MRILAAKLRKVPTKQYFKFKIFPILCDVTYA